MILAALVLFGAVGVYLYMHHSSISDATSDSTAVSDNGSDVVMTQQNPDSQPSQDNTITNDPNTWPSGNRIWDVCRAIAFAEGYDRGIGTAPYDLNNPGDISDGKNLYGYEHHSGSDITHFPTASIGWQWLYIKISNIVNGKSSSYGKDWTIVQIAHTWAGNWQNWAANVANRLGVSISTKLSDYVNNG